VIGIGRTTCLTGDLVCCDGFARHTEGPRMRMANGYTVLLLAPECPGQSVLRAALDEHGFHTRCTADLEVVRTACRTGACDAIVLQGRCAALELLRALRADPTTAGVPALFVVTGASGPVLDALEAGAEHVLVEPIDVAEVAVRLTSLARRWRAQREAQDELQTADAALEAAAVPMALCELDGRITRANRAFLRLWAFSSTEEVVGRSIAALWTDPDRASRIGEALREGDSWSGDLRAVRRDGELREVRVEATVLRTDDGRPQRFMVCVQDVTELLRVNARLTEAQRIARVGNWEWEIGSGVLWWSDEIFHLFGVPPGQPAPTYEWFLSRVHPDDRHLVEAGVALALAGTRDYDVDHRVVLPDGTIRTVHENAVVLRDETGRPIRMKGTVQDVSDRVAAESRRFELEERLQRAHRMEAMGLLASGIAHDFNNLLTVILSSATLLKESLPPKGLAADDALQIVEAGERAAMLTRQLLAFGRKQVLRPERIDLNEVVRGMMKMLRRLVGEDVAMRVESGARHAPVLADRAQIEQVLVNLVVNARDAMPKGGTITLSSAIRGLSDDDTLPAGTYVELSVADNGAGMDAETQAHVFEPFYTTKPSGQGTGLGLATVYGIVTQSGGAVRFDSAPGRGTTFRVLLPWCDAVEKTSTLTPPPARPRATGAHVLLVEDEPHVRALAQRCLEREGFFVSTA
jgi:two-component system cell cycle sensor histidine kinase/response regulator CckA